MFSDNIIKKVCFAVVCFFMINLTVLAFTDVDFSTEEGKAILVMQEHGYINGFGDGSFRPDGTLTRAEFVTIINKMYGFSVATENIFSDINPDDWYYNAVLVGVQAGYIKGMGDGTFEPESPVTREQVCVMLDSILNATMLPYGQKPVDFVSDWARESVEKLISMGVFTLESDAKFRAIEPIKRGETCLALQKCIIDIPENLDVKIDVESMAREELEKILERVIENMETKVLPNCDIPENKKVAEMITEGLKKYLENPDFDYVTTAKETYEVYRKLGYTKAGKLKNLIAEKLETDELLLLYDIFFNEELEELFG